MAVTELQETPLIYVMEKIRDYWLHKQTLYVGLTPYPEL